MKLSDFLETVKAHYNLCEKATPDGFVFVAIKRGMYELPQSGILAQTLLETRLNAYGYHQSKITPGLWTHEWQPICFTLVTDNFGVKYVGKEHTDHLIKCIKENYDITEDWEGKRYLGLTLIGIMTPAAFTFPCQIIFLMPSKVSNARSPRYGKALPTNTRSPIMVPNNNYQKQNKMNRC